MPLWRFNRSNPGRPANPARTAASILVVWMVMGNVVGSVVNAKDSDTTPLTPRRGRLVLTDSDRTYWAFQMPRAVVPPAVRNSSRILNPVDRFLQARLEAEGLDLSPLASPREQVRRLYFDLIGLPPEPEVVEHFERSPTNEAWIRLVDQLLASPLYGERWGRHWLDLVRFAESNGYERDGAKPEAWRYRDYVINAFNQDKPYDQFIREQLAGDELAESWMKDAAVPRSQWESAIQATGFYRLHVWDDEPDSTLVAEFDDLDDVLVTTSTAFLGLTLGCARCHDHKFDPLSQADYYSMLSFIRNVDPYGQHHTGGGGRGTGKILRPLATPGELSQWEKEKAARLKKAETSLAAVSDEKQKKALEEEIQRIKADRAPFPMALSVAEMGPVPKPTYILARGQVTSPGAEVFPRFPEVLGLGAPAIAPPAGSTETTGRRTALAAWIASPTNPLTARVMANRIWQHHFGSGLVRTPDDFGRTGLPPTHPELLDFLALEFIRGGWSVKDLHRRVVTSHAYRMSSRTDHPKALERDEANLLYWRQNLRRVEGEVLRDTFLHLGGKLNQARGGPSVFPVLPPEVHRTQDSAGKGWVDSPAGEQDRRSVYLVVKRALKVPLLETFDFANCTSPMGARSTTTIAPQALMVLNDAFVHEQARRLASRLRSSLQQPVGETEIVGGFRRVLQRRPSSSELAACRTLLQSHRDAARRDGLADPEREALIGFCRAMLNLSETLYVD